MQPLTREVVLELSGHDSEGVKVAALSFDEDLGMTVIVTDDASETLVSAPDFRWVEPDGWRVEELGARNDFLAAVGQDLDRKGGTLSASAGERTFTVPVSEGGWYCLIVKVRDARDPMIQLQFSDYM